MNSLNGTISLVPARYMFYGITGIIPLVLILFVLNIIISLSIISSLYIIYILYNLNIASRFSRKMFFTVIKRQNSNTFLYRKI